MFNLKLKSKDFFQNDILQNVLFVCTNLNETHQLAINKDNEIIKIEDKKIEHYFKIEDEYKIENLVGFNHVPDINSLCLFYEDGNIIQINSEDLNVTKISLTLKIKRISFSPESDRILIVNEKLQLITFDCMFNIANVSELHDESEGEIDHLDVGWGKKETQFHGSEGKSVRTVKEIIGKHLDHDDLKPIFTWKNDGSYFASSVIDPIKECRRIRIYNRDGFLQYKAEEKSGLENTLTWKPDTELLTTSIVDNTGHRVVFFEKNGLKFFDFPLNYKKGEFRIKDFIWSTVSNCVVIFGYETVANESYEKQVVLIYTMSNYHWYLKQKIDFHYTNDEKNLIKKIINLDPNTNEFVPLILNIYFNDGSVREYIYTYHIDSGYNGTVALIDGKKLLITPYQYCSIPPPMYGYSIIFEKEITDVGFSKNSSNLLFVKLNNQKVFLLKESKTIEDDPDFKIDIQQKFTIPTFYSLKINYFQDTKFENFYQFLLREDGRCFAISTNHKDESSLLVIDLISTSPGYSIISAKDKLFDTLSLVEQDTNKKYLIVIAKDGYVWQIDPLQNEAKFEELFLYKNSEKYHLKLFYKIEDLAKVIAYDLNMIFSFTITCSLYMNDYVLQKINCNSMMIHDSKFLIYSTNKQKLRFIWMYQLKNLLDTVSIYKQNEIYNNNRQLLDDQTFEEKYRNLKMCNRFFENESNLINNSVLPIDRSVEVGSRIVCTCSDNNKLVLTLPRGNIEIIQPRILIIDRIKLLLNTLQYYEAFQMMKKNRINLNLIYDHDPILFLLNAQSFFDQIASNDTTDLCLFLSEITQEDVLKTMYLKYDCDLGKNSESSSLYANSTNSSRSNITTGSKDCMDGKICLLPDSEKFLKTAEMDTKLDLISVKIRTIINKLDDKKYFIPKLLTYLKQSIPSVSIALIEVSEEKDEDLRMNALNHLKYIMDINTLIKEALGTYDLEIARMVYNVSNNDPKEYLALLSNFENIDNFTYRKYQIDLHLKRYDLAIINLSKCNPFDRYATEAYEFIKSKNLYKEGIRAMKKSQHLSEHLKKVWVLYGDYLLTKKYFNESLFAYKQGGNYINAIKAAQLSDNWQEVITCAHLCSKQQSEKGLLENQQPINLSKLYKTTAENLSSKGEATHASLIYGYHLNDWVEAIQCLVSNHCWQEVFRILSIAEIIDKKGSDDEIDSKKVEIPVDNTLPRKIFLDKVQFKKLEALARTSLLKHNEEIVDFLIESDNELRSYTERLSLIRQKQLVSIQTNKLTHTFSIESEQYVDDQSTVCSYDSNFDSSEKRSRSDQSQTNSLTTNKSSRKKKKDERNKYRLKEGSKNEDLALIYYTRQRIKSFEKVQPIIKNLIVTMETQGFYDSSRRLHTLYEQILELVDYVINTIWSESLKDTDDYQSIKIEKMTDINQIRDYRIRKPPKFTKTDTKLLTLF